MTAHPATQLPASHKTGEPDTAPPTSASREALSLLPPHPDAFKPLSREDVAGILGISIRTLENWVRGGQLPAPASIGGRRYWHPGRFYAALNDALQPTRSPDGAEPPLVANQPSAITRVPAPAGTKRVTRPRPNQGDAMLAEALALASAQGIMD